MLALEGYEIEEMRSINHIMTVELQFKTPVTQKEARDYLSRVLAKANELEMQDEKEKDFRELAEKPIEVPEDLKELVDRVFLPKATTAADVKKPEKTEGVLKVPVTEEEIADMKRKRLLETTKTAVVNIEAAEEDIVGMKQKRQKQAEKPKKIDWDKACALKKAGWSNKQIADELHANEGTINASIYKNLAKYNAGERKGKREEAEV